VRNLTKLEILECDQIYVQVLGIRGEDDHSSELVEKSGDLVLKCIRHASETFKKLAATGLL
jgi:hypothetical protein